MQTHVFPATFHIGPFCCFTVAIARPWICVSHNKLRSLSGTTTADCGSSQDNYGRINVTVIFHQEANLWAIQRSSRGNPNETNTGLKC